MVLPGDFFLGDSILIEDGSMNELLKGVIMEVLTDTTPYVKVSVH